MDGAEGKFTSLLLSPIHSLTHGLLKSGTTQGATDTGKNASDRRGFKSQQSHLTSGWGHGWHEGGEMEEASRAGQ